MECRDLLPARPSRLRGELTLPADKSIAQRALLVSALMPASDEPCDISMPGADIRSTAQAMEQLGCLAIETDTAKQLTFRRVGRPTQLGSREAPLILDCGNSGTGMRLLTGLLAGIFANRSGCVELHGDASLTLRPMERVAGPLREMGAEITTTAGHAPIRICGPAPLRAHTHHLPVASAQLASAIQLAALHAEGTTTIILPGPARDHTERMLSYLGAEVTRTTQIDGSVCTQISGPAHLTNRPTLIPGDISAAAFWLVAASVHPDARITLPAVGLNPSRTALISTLEDMGAQITITPASAPGPEPVGTLTITSAPHLRGIEVTAPQTADLIDELPVLAVAMAAATRPSTVRDAGELRVKESDRIELVSEFLTNGGVDIRPQPDGWQLFPHPVAPSAARVAVRTEADHRIAMAAAIADLTAVVGPRLIIDDPECVAVSYPEFFTHLTALATPLE